MTLIIASPFSSPHPNSQTFLCKVLLNVLTAHIHQPDSELKEVCASSGITDIFMLTVTTLVFAYQKWLLVEECKKLVYLTSMF